MHIFQTFCRGGWGVGWGVGVKRSLKGSEKHNRKTGMRFFVVIKILEVKNESLAKTLKFNIHLVITLRFWVYLNKNRFGASLNTSLQKWRGWLKMPRMFLTVLLLLDFHFWVKLQLCVFLWLIHYIMSTMNYITNAFVSNSNQIEKIDHQFIHQ